MDKLGPLQRSENMRRIRSRHTSPEVAVRSMVHRLGFRFRLHDKKLPGKPDLVFARYKKIIFVHGCFWHQHTECREGRLPNSRQDYWTPKLQQNISRDKEHREKLIREGWEILVVWECELKDRQKLMAKLFSFLSTHYGECRHSTKSENVP